MTNDELLTKALIGATGALANFVAASPATQGEADEVARELADWETTLLDTLDSVGGSDFAPLRELGRNVAETIESILH